MNVSTPKNIERRMDKNMLALYKKKGEWIKIYKHLTIKGGLNETN